MQLALEVCNNGDLQQLLQDRKLTWPEIRRSMVDVANGLLYLSAANFVHRDIAARCVVSARACVCVAHTRTDAHTHTRTHAHTHLHRLYGVMQILVGGWMCTLLTHARAATVVGAGTSSWARARPRSPTSGCRFFWTVVISSNLTPWSCLSGTSHSSVVTRSCCTSLDTIAICCSTIFEHCGYMLQHPL